MLNLMLDKSIDHAKQVCYGSARLCSKTYRADVLALDTGCVWGGCLSALEVSASTDGRWQQSLVQVRCKAAQIPG